MSRWLVYVVRAVGGWNPEQGGFIHCATSSRTHLLGDVEAASMGAAISRASTCWPELRADNITLAPAPEPPPPPLGIGHTPDECLRCRHDAHAGTRCEYRCNGVDRCICEDSQQVDASPVYDPPPDEREAPPDATASPEAAPRWRDRVKPYTGKPVARRPAPAEHPKPLPPSAWDDPYGIE